VEAEEGA
jgi:hypothetical protein